MNSIFQRKNPAIEKLFEEAGSPKKVMCVPIDYAKKQHTALVCNGEGSPRPLGESGRGPFNIHNNPAGIELLEDVIAGLRRKHSVQKAHVFFGGEDCSAIAFDFIHALLQKHYLGIGLNARDAAKERENQVASAYRIHHLVDRLMPGFLDEKQSVLTPFAQPCLWVMSQPFSPRQILARKSEAMAEKLRLFMVQDAEAKVEKLKALARSVLPPPAAPCETLQDNLTHEVSGYQHVGECIGATDKDIAHRLAATPGAMLTTVPGIGCTLAAALYAEIGDPARDRCLKRLSSYAGLVARLKQTGGPDNEAPTRGRSRRACVPLKRTIMDIALKVGQYGHEELKADYQRRVENGQDPRLTMGRRLLRICTHLIRHTNFFLPPSLLRDSEYDVRRDYDSRAWDKIPIEWRDAAAIQHFQGDRPPSHRPVARNVTRYGKPSARSRSKT